MVSFRRNADQAVFEALMGFDLVSDSTPIEETVLALGRMEA